MKAENITQAVSAGTTYCFKELKSSSMSAVLYLSGDSTNCKLSYIHGAGSLAAHSDAEKKEVLDFMIGKCKGAVILNTTQKKVFDFIKANYQTYYSSEVPIGYNNTFQYHICIRNHIYPNTNCKIPAKTVVETKAVPTLSKEVIKTKLLALLKSKRRRADYVDDFINSL